MISICISCTYLYSTLEFTLHSGRAFLEVVLEMSEEVHQTNGVIIQFPSKYKCNLLSPIAPGIVLCLFPKQRLAGWYFALTSVTISFS